MEMKVFTSGLPGTFRVRGLGGEGTPGSQPGLQIHISRAKNCPRLGSAETHSIRVLGWCRHCDGDSYAGGPDEWWLLWVAFLSLSPCDFWGSPWEVAQML